MQIFLVDINNSHKNDQIIQYQHFIHPPTEMQDSHFPVLVFLMCNKGLELSSSRFTVRQPNTFLKYINI
jgi:hypothetical protein